MKSKIVHTLVSCVLSFTVAVGTTSCAGQMPTMAELESRMQSKDASIEMLLKRMQLDAEQTKALIALLQESLAVRKNSSGSSEPISQDAELLQKLQELDAKKNLLSKELESYKARYGDITSKIETLQDPALPPSLYERVYALEDKVASTETSQNGVSAQIAALLAQKADIEEKISSHSEQLFALDQKNQSFLSANQMDIKNLFDGIEALKLAQGQLSDTQLETARELEKNLMNMNKVFDTIFQFNKTTSEDNKDQQELFQKLIAKSLARVGIIDISNPQHPTTSGFGSANLILKMGNSYVFSTAAHVSRDVYEAKRFGDKKFGLQFTPIQTLSINEMAKIPVAFEYEDQNKIQVLVSDKYRKLTDEIHTKWATITALEGQLKSQYASIEQMLVAFTSLQGITIPEFSEDQDVDFLIFKIESLSGEISTREIGSEEQEKFLELRSKLDQFFQLASDREQSFNKISELEYFVIAEDSALVVVRDTSGQFDDITPLLELKDGILVPQKVTLQGREVLVPFDVRSLFSKKQGGNIGVLARIFACGIPFDNLNSDIQDQGSKYNGSSMIFAEYDAWAEEKSISRVHQPKPDRAFSGSKRDIPSYFQVSGSMNGGSSGGLNYSVDSFRAPVLTSKGKVLLTKEGQKMLLGYDNTLRTTDGTLVYFGAPGVFTTTTPSMLLPVTVLQDQLMVGGRPIVGDFAFQEVKVLTGLGVNSFGVGSFFSTLSSHVANFSHVSTELKQKLEKSLNVQLPSVYDEETLYTF